VEILDDGVCRRRGHAALPGVCCPTPLWYCRERGRRVRLFPTIPKNDTLRRAATGHSLPDGRWTEGQCLEERRPGPISRFLNSLPGAQEQGQRSDQELLGQFVACADEAAFDQLVRRHGSLVLSAARSVVGSADADDVFQATFLVLARRAASVRYQ